MEANRKRRGFMKTKLVKPFYRSAKPSPASSTTVLPYINTTAATKVIRSVAPSAGAVDFFVNHDYVTPAHPKQIISYAPPDNGYDSYYARLEKIYGVVADESVDLKAATYISCVQERFKLEQVNSERKDASQDIQW
ncbi:uncharacterized protein LOC127804174 [Diospyros lotus]|uniref:uncharacterized protein LOC127804174 n=1 Tax=Diospyros lotus TaxID=55363 RepID=UPI00224FF962|nr:uncharacterized protein LOC127804174 [Diospyros lotus]